MPIPQLFEGALSSREFQTSLVSHFIKAYPEKQCLCFIHVPKSAGTDLSAHLSARYPSLLTSALNPADTGPTEFFRSIKDLILESRPYDQIYIHGHTRLGTFVEDKFTGHTWIEELRRAGPSYWCVAQRSGSHREACRDHRLRIDRCPSHYRYWEKGRPTDLLSTPSPVQRSVRGS